MEVFFNQLAGMLRRCSSGDKCLKKRCFSTRICPFHFTWALPNSVGLAGEWSVVFGMHISDSSRLFCDFVTFGIGSKFSQNIKPIFARLSPGTDRAQASKTVSVRALMGAQSTEPSRSPQAATRELARQARLGTPAQVAQLLASLRCGHLRANAYHYNALLSAHEKVSAWSIVLGLADAMEQEKVDLDDACRHVRMAALGTAAHWEAACDSLAPATQRGCNALLRALDRGGEAEKALRLLRRMPKMHLSPNENSYGASVSALASCGRWVGAASLLEEMQHCRLLQSLPALSAAFAGDA
eukprot:s2675_g1.t2